MGSGIADLPSPVCPERHPPHEFKSGVRAPQAGIIVDDEPNLLEAIREAFERAHREVVACRTFEEAREKVLTEYFDCLITDVRLGAFNGLQLAVIARDRNRDIGIIVFSGFDDSVLREEAEHLGATYLVKPVSSERLLQFIDNY